MRSIGAIVIQIIFVHPKGHGFELNPYDMCVANANIEGKKFTVFWYVDDNKISHVDPKVVDTAIETTGESLGRCLRQEETSTIF